MLLELMRNEAAKFTRAAVRLSRVFFVAIGSVVLLLSAAAWIAGGQSFVAATVMLTVVGLGLVVFAVVASAELCASVASKVLALVGIPL
jgi:hypothetical protein